MTQSRSCTLAELAGRFGGEVAGDPATRVAQVATLESAGPGEIGFLAHARYRAELARTRASAVIVGPEDRDAATLARIITPNPYLYFARVSAYFNPPPAVVPGVHESAVVEEGATVAASASIGANAVIGKRARIGEGTVIGACCAIGDDASIGDETRLYANVTVYHACSIGARCVIHSGVVIGSDGFGIALDNGVWRKIPQIGRAIIGDDVEIGANTAIDRGALDDTIIEEGAKIDNLVQVAHNVRIGAHTAIAGCVGIAGSAKIGRHCQLGGAAMIYGHITIADGITVSAGTLVMKSLRERGTYTGVYPFSSHAEWLKNAARLRQLDELAGRVRELEERLRDHGK